MTLALLSLGFFGISDLLYKRAQIAGARPATFMLAQAVFYNLAAWGGALLTGHLQFNATIALYAPLGGTAAFLWSTLLMHSLRRGDASVNVPLFKLSFLLTAVAAILFLGEPLTLPKGLALGLAVVAVLMFASLFGSAQGKLHRESLPPLLGAIAFSAVFALIQKLAVAGGTPGISFLPFQAGVYLLIAGIFAACTGSLRTASTGLRFAPICGVLLATAILLLLISLETGDASVNVPIVQMSFVLTSILAVLTLGEPLSRRKVGGIAFASLAVLAFTFVR